jgi:hypothetical protein
VHVAACRAGGKQRRTDVISTGIPRITRRSDAEARCPFRVDSVEKLKNGVEAKIRDGLVATSIRQ